MTRRPHALRGGLRPALAALMLAGAGIAGAQGAAAPIAGAPDAPARSAFKVCSDPNSLPFSNDKGAGYENRIAELMAKDLGLPLTYFYFPNRMNFIRNTLKFKLPTDDYPCDIVIGVPAEFDQVSVTKPYYRSTYVLLYPKGKGLDAVHTSDDLLSLPQAQLAALHIGLYDKSPGSIWLARHRMVDVGVPYQTMNADPDFFAGQDIERDLAAGKLDAAILWGPIAGYLVKRGKVPGLVVAPMKSERELPLDYSMAMGVRYGEPQWKKQIEDLLVRRKDDIRAILVDAAVPLVDIPAESGK